MITRKIAIDVDKDGLLWVFAQHQRINLHFEKQLKDDSGRPDINVYSCTADPETITLLAIRVPLVTAP